MTNKLGITEGEWIKNYFAVSEDNSNPFYIIQGFDNKSVCALELDGSITVEDLDHNAELIADAGTTANKCGKLPSQLLQENEEMKAMLDKGINEIRHLKAEYRDATHCVKYIFECEQLLTKINNQ